MTSRTQKTAAGLSTSIAVGTLLVPLSAVAAVLLSNPADPIAEPALSTAPTATAGIEAVSAPSPGPDIEVACGEAGLELVQLERAGTISGFQQSALDALRPICLEAGLGLPGGPLAPERGPVAVETVAEPAPLIVVETIDDDRDHDDYRDDDDGDWDDDWDDDDWDDD